MKRWAVELFYRFKTALIDSLGLFVAIVGGLLLLMFAVYGALLLSR